MLRVFVGRIHERQCMRHPREKEIVMEGLLQPTHLFFVVLIVLIMFGVPVLIVRVARARRARCMWTRAKAKRRLWLGVTLIVVGLLIPALTAAQGTSPISIFCLMLFWAGVFHIARAAYRRRDIETTNTGAVTPVR